MIAQKISSEGKEIRIRISIPLLRGICLNEKSD